MKNKSRVIVLDPCCFSPFYDLNLVHNLAELGWPIQWVASDFTFETLPSRGSFPVNPFFFTRFPANRLLSAKPINDHDWLRRPVKMALYPLEMARFNVYLKSLQPGILHVQWAHLPCLDRTLWIRWKRMGWKLVYTAHDPLPLKGTTPHPFFAMRQNLLKHADAILVHSQKGRQQLIQLELHPDKIHCIQLGPTLMTDMEPVNQDVAQHELGLPDNALTVLFFGFIKPYKGLDVLLKSMPTIQAAFPEFHLLVAGKLTEPFSRYEKLVKALPSRPFIHWNLEFIPSNRIPLYFCAADVVVTPYLQGSSSSVIDLAHYFGNPVVTTAVGGLPEQINPEHGDLVVPPDSPVLLAEAVINVLKKRQERTDAKRVSVYPYGLIQSKWSAIAAYHGALYDRLRQST
jgi:glycosyltransferase involved in cell wall biosynthesis